MLLYIVRHGDPIYNPDSLTERGQKQAEALAHRLKRSKITSIYSSPNGRAKMTADPTAKMLGLEYGIEDWMSENYAWQEFSGEYAPGKHGWTFLIQNTKIKTDPAIKNGAKWYEADFLKNAARPEEGYKRIKANSDDFLARLGYVREGDIYRIENPSSEKVAAFCHQGFGLVWLSYLLAIPPYHFWGTFDMAHSSVTILEFANNKDGYTAPKCLCLSDFSHIFAADGLEMLYHNSIEI